MIPIKFLSKLGVYDIEIHGITLKVRVAYDPDAINIGVTELRSQFGTTVVGIKIHSPPRVSPPNLVALCVGNRCLIIVLDNRNKMFLGLKSFLSDKDICFVGMKCSYPLHLVLGELSDRIVNVNELVARFLMKPNLIGLGLDVLAREVGVDLKNESAYDEILKDWKAKAFSKEEIEYAVRDAHACYLIAKKIFG